MPGSARPSSRAGSRSRRRPSPIACDGSSATGVITGYRAEIEPRALGYAIAAIVRVRPTPRQLHRIPELARATPEVVECYRITGDDCFLMKLHLRSIDDLEPVLDRFVMYGQTTTSIIQSTPGLASRAAVRRVATLAP